MDTANPLSLRIHSLHLRDWRNLTDVRWQPGPRFNVLHGRNGAGKSSLLEAIDYLSMLRSFRRAKAAEIIGEGCETAHVSALVSSSPLPHQMEVGLGKPSQRRIIVDGKRPRGWRDWRMLLPSVLFHPGDLDLAAGGPERRRSFLDRVLAIGDPGYGEALASYEKALRSRNQLLRRGALELRVAGVYDAILAQHGLVLLNGRRALVERLSSTVAASFGHMMKEHAALRLQYRSRAEPSLASLRQLFSESRRKDQQLGYTTEGPHTDDLGMWIGALDARRQASQGQQRAMALALKIAEVEILSEKLGRVPVLLLDDVSSELDRFSNRHLFEVLARMGGQVFLTTAQRDLIEVDEERQDFLVDQGSIVSEL